MKTNHTFAISAIVRRNKKNKRGEVPVYIRIIINGKRTEIATKQSLKPELWDSELGYAKGRDKISKAVNETIELHKLKAKQQYNKWLESDKELNLEDIKNGILGIEGRQPTLMEVFTEMLSDVKSKIGVNYSKSCYSAYVATDNHLRNYLSTQFNLNDIRLRDLTYKFIAGFEVFLKTTGRNRQNGSIKHIQRLRMAIKLAMKQELMMKDPFIRYSISKERVIRHPLNSDELARIEARYFSTEKLQVIKDMFIFTCYTGLSFIDAKTLQQKHIGKGVDGAKWIFTERRKTGNPCRIPLLPPAEAIINKYRNHPKVKDSGCLLPCPSNQKFNDYLKEIADLCNIRKKLTVHIGRHTFATTVALENGVPIEIVKEMLGHDKIETTEIYAKVKDQTIANAMKQLREKLK